MPTAISKNASRLVVAAMLIVHILLILRQFPPSTLADGGYPVKGDLARYLATVEGVERLGGSGIDPLHMAGYPVGAWNSIGKKGYEVLVTAIPFGSLANRFYGTVVVLALVLPLILAFTVRIVAKVPSPLAMILALGVWHLDSQVAYFWQFGNVLYPGACALGPLSMVVACHGLFRGRWSSLVLAGALLGILFYAHTVVVLAVMPPLVVMTIIACVERRSWMPLAQLTTMTLVALAIAAPWLHYLLATRQDCVPQPQQWFQAGIKHLLADLFSDRSYGRPFDRNSILHAVAVAGLFGTLQAVRRRDYAIIGLGVAGVWCLIVAYTFSFVPALRAVQPYRFLTPAIIAMLAPAVAAVMEAFAIVKAATRPMQIVVAALVVVMLPALTASVLDLAQPPIPCGLLPADRHLLDTLKAMPTTGRVLCQPETVAHLVPLWTGKPVLGGLNDQAFLRHRHAGFLADGRCFGRTAGEWSETDFTRALIDFKVDVVVLSTPEWIEFARTMPRVLRCEQSSAEYSIWRVVR